VGEKKRPGKESVPDCCKKTGGVQNLGKGVWGKTLDARDFIIESRASTSRGRTGERGASETNSSKNAI